jgi:uncharacterized membrane-anchored protein
MSKWNRMTKILLWLAMLAISVLLLVLDKSGTIFGKICWIIVVVVSGFYFLFNIYLVLSHYDKKRKNNS